MTMLESTISMIKVMPESDLVEIQNFARKLLMRHDADCPFPLKNREDIYKELETSRQQASEGKCQDMGQALAEIRKKYGL